MVASRVVVGQRQAQVIHWMLLLLEEAQHPAAQLADQMPKLERATMEDVLAIAEPFFGSGTDFHRPLTEARKIIEGGKTFKKADIVFITDGIAEVTDDFLREFLSFKKDTNTRVFVVLVDFARTSERYVRRWADQVYRVTDLARDAENAAKTVFAAV